VSPPGKTAAQHSTPAVAAASSLSPPTSPFPTASRGATESSAVGDGAGSDDDTVGEGCAAVATWCMHVILIARVISGCSSQPSATCRSSCAVRLPTDVRISLHQPHAVVYRSAGSLPAPGEAVPEPRAQPGQSALRRWYVMLFNPSSAPSEGTHHPSRHWSPYATCRPSVSVRSTLTRCWSGWRQRHHACCWHSHIQAGGVWTGNY